MMLAQASSVREAEAQRTVYIDFAPTVDGEADLPWELNAMADSGTDKLPSKDWLHSWLGLIPLAGVAGIVVILIFAAQVRHGSRWEVLATGIGVAAAAAMAGGLVGFLFGIPRTVDSKGSTDQSGTQYQGNTNLEQISDWLTKILVGVGLVQLARAPNALKDLAHSLQAPLGNLSSSGTFGLTLAIAYAVLGFFFLYLWARVRFAGELKEADTLNQLLDQRDSAKSNALTLANQQLSPQNASPPTQDVLNSAVSDAPVATRLQIFGQAELVRNANWRDQKPVMERSIPVFRALTSADTEDKDYRSHGSLGWSLKDQAAPDWLQARAELTTAIVIRDNLKVDGWAMFELNRALCNIHLDPGFGTPAAPSEALVKLVNDDLEKASSDVYAAPVLTNNPDLVAWLASHPLQG